MHLELFIPQPLHPDLCTFLRKTDKRGVRTQKLHRILFSFGWSRSLFDALELHTCYQKGDGDTDHKLHGSNLKSVGQTLPARSCFQAASRRARLELRERFTFLLSLSHKAVTGGEPRKTFFHAESFPSRLLQF